MKTKRTTNKLITAALTLVLVLGLFAGAPFTAAAADEYGGDVITSDSETAAPSHEGGDGANAGVEPFAVIDVGTPTAFNNALTNSQSGDTIRLTANITTGRIAVEDKSITIDLDRKYKLTVDSAYDGLDIYSGGEVKLAGELPGTAEFNITSTYYGVNAIDGGKGTVTNVTSGTTGVYATGKGSYIKVGGNATGNGAAGCGARAESGAFITVGGDAKATSTGSNSYGAYAESGASVTVGGDATGGANGAYATGEGSSIKIGGDAYGSTYYGVRARSGASVTVGGDATGVNNVADASGKDSKGKGSYLHVAGNVLATGSATNAVSASDSASIIIGGNVLATGAGSIGAYAQTGASVTVGGDATGTGNGVYATSPGSSIKVGGDVTGTSATGMEVFSGASVTVGGSVTGNATGAFATGGGSSIKVEGDVMSIANYGVAAEYGASITVSGDATGYYYGAYVAYPGSSVKVDGNVKGTSAASYGVRAHSGAVATIGGDATGIGANSRGASATGVGSEVTVFGDTAGGRVGAEALDGASVIVRGDVTSDDFGVTSTSTSPTTDLTTVTVDGVIIADGIYVATDSVYHSPSDAQPVSSKAGYLEYKFNNFYVWVRDKQGVPPVLSITPSRAILTKAADTATFTAKLNTDDIDLSKFSWIVTDENGNEVPSLGASAQINISAGSGTNTFTINATTAGMASARFWIVTATYGEKYVSTATVEVMPGGLKPGNPSVPGNTTVKLLESKAQVNTAKDRGALVPVLITNRNVATLGVMAEGEVSAMETARTGADLDAKIELVTKDKKGEWVPVPRDRMTARWYKPDARYIEINAPKGAKSLNDVYVKIVPNVGSVEIDAIGKLNITVTEKYPKITLKTGGSLNMALPGDSVLLTATSDDGRCEVLSAAPVKDADIGKVIFSGGKLTLDPAKAKAGTVSMAVEVWVEGYKTPYTKTPTVSVKTADALPKIKLSKKTLVLADGGWVGDGAAVFIQSNDKTPTEDILAKIEAVAFEGNIKNGVQYDSLDKTQEDYTNGRLLLFRKSAAVSGKGDVVVTFAGGREVRLPLTLTMLKAEDLKVISKKNAVTVHMNHTSNSSFSGIIMDIPVTVNADNVIATDWKINRVAEDGKWAAYDALHPHSEAFEASAPGLDNNVTLSVKDRDHFVDWFSENNTALKNKKVDLHIGSFSVGLGKEFKMSVTMTNGVESGKLKASNSGKINVADKDATVAVTLTLKNTASHIKSIDWDADPDCKNSDFELVSYGKDSFEVKLKSDRTAGFKMEAQTMTPRILLENGNTVSPTLKLTPVYTKSKTTQSAKAVTIYKGTPQTGADIVLDITSPPGAEFGAAVINQASVDKLNLGWLQGAGVERDVFELTQSGKNKYTLSLTDKRNLPVQLVASGANKGKPVKNADGSDKIAASKSYTVQIELWAKGSYLTNSDGSPKFVEGKLVPLKNEAGAAKTGPTLVTVKIDLK